MMEIDVRKHKTEDLPQTEPIHNDDLEIQEKWTLNNIYFHFSGFGVAFLMFVFFQSWQNDFDQSQIMNAVYVFTKPIYHVSLGFLGHGLAFLMLKKYFPAVLLAINDKVNSITVTDILINKASAGEKLSFVQVVFLGELLFWVLILKGL